MCFLFFFHTGNIVIKHVKRICFEQIFRPLVALHFASLYAIELKMADEGESLQVCNTEPVCISDFENHAKAFLPKDAWDHYSSGANQEVTLRENRLAFDRYLTNDCLETQSACCY